VKLPQFVRFGSLGNRYRTLVEPTKVAVCDLPKSVLVTHREYLCGIAIKTWRGRRSMRGRRSAI